MFFWTGQFAVSYMWLLTQILDFVLLIAFHSVILVLSVMPLVFNSGVIINIEMLK